MPKRAAASSSPDNAKKSKSAKAAEDTKVTPYDAFFKRLFAVKDRNPKILGPAIIRGISRDEDEDETEDETEESDDEKEVDKSKYTAEQMETLRYVMITQSMQDRQDEMAKLVLGDQAGGMCMMFTTSFSYDVMGAYWEVKRRIYPRVKGPAAKFEVLFAFTHIIDSYDTWMHDNEGGMEDWVKDLGATWKRLLKNSNEKLKIDSEFTRPGIICFLEQFKEKVEEALNQYAETPLDFKFQ